VVGAGTGRISPRGVGVGAPVADTAGTVIPTTAATAMAAPTQALDRDMSVTLGQRLALAPPDGDYSRTATRPSACL